MRTVERLIPVPINVAGPRGGASGGARFAVSFSLMCLLGPVSPALHAAECNFTESNRIDAWSVAAARAKPERVVAPVYPPELLRQGVNGKVLAQLRIGNNGRVSNTLAITAETGGGAFEKAVAAVIPQWRFNPEIGCQCQPVASTEELSISFQIKEGQPDISVTRPAQPDAGEPPLMITGIKNAKNVFGEAYPRSALRAGEEGAVYGIVTIDAESGIAQEMEVTHVVANPDYRSAFSKATEVAVKGLKFGFEGTPKQSPFRGCFSINYQLRQ